MTARYSLGWDIGGAHLKAAVLDEQANLCAVYQQACPLWQGLEQLHNAFHAITSQLKPAQYRHAVTMSGELVDGFANRDEGVMHILNTLQSLLPETPFWVFAGVKGLLPIAQITADDYGAIASANWLASAQYVATQRGNGLFVDIGSTTTDILVLKNGQVQAEGYTDYARLKSRELVYTGLVRTPVMAIGKAVRDGNEKVPLMAEYFATMADVYRLTGELNEAHDQTTPADGGEKTILASSIRLARMLGCDYCPSELPRWQKVAENLRLQQLQTLEDACIVQLSRMALPNQSPFIGAGVGRFLVRQLAAHCRYPYLDFDDLLPNCLQQSALSAADCAPAVAVAWLALNQPVNEAN